MNHLSALLAELQANQIKLWLEGERLRVSAPPGVLTEAIRAQLTAHKAELLLLLQKHELEQIRPAKRTGKEPLSFGQQRLWFLQQMEANGVYNMPAVMRLTGQLNQAAIQQAVDAIVERHESLRTIFIEEQGEVYQQINPPAPVAIPLLDLTALPAATQYAEALKLADAEMRRTFDLAKGPLLRLLLIRFHTPAFTLTDQAVIADDEHLLVFNMHHIISDGVSIALLIDELRTLYSAALAGQTPPLPPLPVQYADFAIWQRKWLQGKILEEQSTYWQEQLRGAPPLLELPTDRPRPAVQRFRGKTIHFMIDGATTRKVVRFSQERQATLFMTLLSAYGLLLARYSNQQDILIGTPIAGRAHSEVQNLIGLFINTLVMRVKLTDNPTVNQLVEQVRQTALDGYAHQDLPFERLIDLLDLERNLSYNPVFQAMFAMQTVPNSALTLPGLTLTPLDLDNDLAKFDLNLMMTETGQGLEGAFEYNSDLFDEATAQRMVTHLQTILRAMVEQPQAQVATLPVLTPAERKQLLVDWNDTIMAYPRTQCIHQLFEAQVERTPHALALVDAATGVELTYRELNARANQVAHRLQMLGVEPDERVGLCVERSPKLLIGLLGILKAGAAYVPLDPAFPKHRLDLMLADAQPAILVTESYFADDFADVAAPKLYLDSVGDQVGELAGQPTHNLTSPVTPEHLAYIIYTSGSTGKPKGVELRHQSVVNFLWSMKQQPGLGAQDRLLAVTTISFDIAVLELYLPLISGATVLLANEEMSADPLQLMGLLPQATVMQATPATWRMLLLAGWEGQSNLRILVGGEALPTKLAQQLVERSSELWNLYGPTETTVWSSLYRVEAAALDLAQAGGEGSTVAIGRPIGNTQLYVLDAQGQPTPIGVPGELYIGGAGLARGYRHLPAMTEEKFLPNIFWEPVGNGRIYRTGDLARYRPNGVVEYLGRIDNQVKIRGFRIELGEIESALGQHPQIEQAVVVAQSDNSGGKRLIAFLIAATSAPAGDELRTFLRGLLPDYMIPAAFVQLERLPLTPNGKIDRRALAQMTTGAVELATPYVAPANDLEAQLVAIWAEVLNLDPAQVGTRHNFFDLGGHSLLAIQVLSRIRTTFQVELPIRELMDSPTIAAIAAAIEPMQQLAALFTSAADEVGADRESIEL